MFYREAGQFKTSYEADAAIFPLRQDRIAMAAILVIAYAVIPLAATPYMFSALLIPCLILALAALGLNILTGYAGQLSLVSNPSTPLTGHETPAPTMGIAGKFT